MTITEHLTRQMKTINLVKWGGVGIALVLGFVHVHDANLPAYAWIIAPMIPTLAIMIVLGKRLKCPRCQASLSQNMYARDRVPLRFCPKCGTDFNEPMPAGPVNPIS
jgi:ribosomal protein S27AE